MIQASRFLHSLSVASGSEVSWLSPRKQHVCHALSPPAPVCCSYERGNEGLQRDIEELKASLGPAGAGTLRARGAARYAAGDYAGAVEAFTQFLGLPESSVAGGGEEGETGGEVEHQPEAWSR